MQPQNFRNHARYVPEFHFVMLGLIAILLVLSVIYLFSGVTLPSVMFVLISVTSFIGWLKIRRFPLAAQDRAIRAEENLRYFSLTGKRFDNRLTMQQIIALRFAADEELVSLVERTLKENLGNRDIKQAIQRWRADHHRA
jgi:hypothetical protein